MKKLGIIGGLGPETTAEFYLEVIFGCQRINPSMRPEILIDSVAMDLEMEEEFINKGEKGEYLSLLVNSAKKLESAGVDFLVVPCNSVHVFIEEIRNAVKVPVLSILEETREFLKLNNIKEVGLISTVITQKQKLYENILNESGVKVVLPNELEQAKIGKIIHHLVMNRQGNKERTELIKIIENFERQGIQDVVLACTDLQLLLPAHNTVRIHDTMKILADSVVSKITES